ncbi:MAG TPA: amidohydrolase family protein [Gemmatimonadaceae bacterium]|nr:amidohydrolase family protein [Gemmatimonadaceae bacterium]
MRLEPLGILDAHVHFWDPSVLRYPWLEGLPELDRPFLPASYASAAAGIPIDTMILVEANCAPHQTLGEADFFERVAATGPHVAGIVAFASLTETAELDRTLDSLTARPLVKGIRHNIQGERQGFCTQPSFVEGVRKVGARGLTFDLCATHGQLREVLELVRACPDTRFVLDHCGKPAIRDRLLDPWRADIADLAECANVWCKVSGLVTEASPSEWREADLVPYASHVVEAFGTDRVMYGSDWPVLTLAARYAAWFGFTEWLTKGWSDAERRGFYRENARRVYEL